MRHMRRDPSRLFTRGAFVAVLFAISCSSGGGGGCGGGGCAGGCGDGTYTYPRDDPNRPDAILQPEIARVRITQGFIDFIKPQLPTLIKSALGSQPGMRIDGNDILHVAIPDQDLFDIGVAEARLREGELLLWLDDLDQRIDLRFEEPNGVRLILRNLRLGVQFDLKEDALGTTSSCPVVGALGPGPTRHAAEITINALIEPGAGPDPDRNIDIGVTLGTVQLNDLDIEVAGSSVYCQEPECRDCAVEVFGNCLDPDGRCVECDIFCGGITNGLLSLVTALLDLVRPLLNNVRSALADVNNQPAKLETQVALGDLLPIDALKQSKPFGIFVAPEVGKFPVLDRGSGLGMEITATGGAEAELADCIGALEPFFEAKGPVPVLGGTDSHGRPYHVGMAFSQSMINQVLYAIHRSGSLCIKLSSADVKELTGGGFTLNAAVLSLLASDLSKLASDAAPVIIQLKPRFAPHVELGSGMVTGMDMDGNDIVDWLISLDVREMGIAFHALVHDRYVRIFEVTADIGVGLNITILPDNSLEVAVGDLKIDNFVEVFNEILPNARFEEILPTLIDVALQALLQNELKFDLDVTNTLSDALGGAPIYMRINDIQRDGPNDDYLSLSLTFSDQPGAPLRGSARTMARLAPKPELVERVDGVPRATGRARLIVGEDLPYDRQRELEYQVRVDNGLWRTWMAPRPDGTLLIADPKLRLDRTHQIDVRARVRGDYETLDPLPVQVEARVDTLPPRVVGELHGTGVAVTANDLASEPGELTVRARFDEGAWFDVGLTAGEESASGRVDLNGVNAHVLELVATDGLGNDSAVERVVVGRAGLSASEDPGASSSGSGCGCASTSASDTGLWALAVLGLALTLRRRR
jgi:MYXO-CTERM domain-containing protein